LIDFFKVFSGGLAKFPEFIYKEYFCSNPNLGDSMGIPAFCHMEDPANAAKSSPGVPGPVCLSRSVMMGGVVTSE